MSNSLPFTMDLTTVLEAMPDSLVIINQAGKIVHINAQTENLFGYPRDELLGNTVEKLMPVRYQSNHLSHRTHYFSSPRTRPMGANLELYGQKKNGLEFPIEISLSPLNTGKEILTLAALRDITERKKAEAKFKGILEATPDALVIINREGKIILINAQAEKLFDYNRVELLDKPIETLIPERYGGRHIPHRTGYFNTSRVRPMGMGLELYGCKKNGLEFPVEISLSPLEAEEGMLTLAAVRDVTERKHFEHALQEKNIELEKANLAKNNFLASMSHELRTPLNAIIGFTGTLLMKLPGPLTQDQTKQLNTISRSAKHLLSLINDLLDLAKIESDKVEINFEAVNCQSIIEEIATTLRPEAQKKNLDFMVEMPKQTIWIKSDKRALNQIIINLVNNAIKFTDNGSIRLVLSVENDVQDEYIKFSIIDTGIGIKSDDQSKLFNAFEKMHNTKHVEGTGLGLYLSQKLAFILGTCIICDSEFNKGSTFSLLFSNKKKVLLP